MQLSVAQKETAVPPSAIALQELVETAESDANAAALRPEIPGLDAASAAVEKISNGMEAASDIADALDGLLSKLDFFITLMDKVSEVHPYTKMAWTILSAALKVIPSKAQKERDKKMKELIEKMTTVYEFLCDARDLRSDKARMGVLSRLATQTVDCAHFISSCLEKTNFVMRLVAQRFSKWISTEDRNRNEFGCR
ncbi:hypothetical protein CALVIDRAFT_540412 [Calocera viscosa TUFC12733]|uniref:Fungal STAND N-terminal Goodbye domain-containing protein n=1 Tax=Calocera viscosa (strain TUFC12733) TaxID=1330018 RepID=A0A167ITI9_CALVF|nr:hypothetical protein CALVIDRAFT_540412 [Calocera viscosa TUFC12733]